MQSEARITGAPAETPEAPWDALHEQPMRVAALLAQRNGLTADENLENLEAAVEDALRERGIKPDVWALFRAVEAETRADIVRDVLRMFHTAGML